MRCFVLHESGDRLRVRVPKLNMSYRQADLLEYYLQNIPGVKKASVDERTGNATIQFADRDADKRSILTEALADYDETSEQVAACAEP